MHPRSAYLHCSGPPDAIDEGGLFWGDGGQAAFPFKAFLTHSHMPCILFPFTGPDPIGEGGLCWGDGGQAALGSGWVPEALLLPQPTSSAFHNNSNDTAPYNAHCQLGAANAHSQSGAATAATTHSQSNAAPNNSLTGSDMIGASHDTVHALMALCASKPGTGALSLLPVPVPALNRQLQFNHNSHSQTHNHSNDHHLQHTHQHQHHNNHHSQQQHKRRGLFGSTRVPHSSIVATAVAAAPVGGRGSFTGSTPVSHLLVRVFVILFVCTV